MEKSEHEQYMKDQIEEIEKHKWIESEKNGHDMGESAIKDWIHRYAAIFRKEWNKLHRKG